MRKDLHAEKRARAAASRSRRTRNTASRKIDLKERMTILKDMERLKNALV
jgi:hypothetical protein